MGNIECPLAIKRHYLPLQKQLIMNFEDYKTVHSLFCKLVINDLQRIAFPYGKDTNFVKALYFARVLSLQLPAISNTSSHIKVLCVLEDCHQNLLDYSISLDQAGHLTEDKNSLITQTLAMLLGKIETLKGGAFFSN